MESKVFNWMGSYIYDKDTEDLYSTEDIKLFIDGDGRLISQKLFSNVQWVTKGFRCHETGFLAYSLETLAA